jgi:hypothetical protein
VSYKLFDNVKSELRQLSVVYEVVSERELRNKRLSKFNMMFLLALDCYMPGVAKKLFEECKEDVEAHGILFAERKWRRFIEGSLSGRGRLSEVISNACR